MIRKILRALFGSYCSSHRVLYRSDFCPQHVRAMAIRIETHDVVNREHSGGTP